MSFHAHSGHSQSRRDDLESLIYFTIYLFTNKVPWSSTLRDKVSSEKVLEAKRNMNTYEVTADCPRKILKRRNGGTVEVRQEVKLRRRT